jgi:hypothetical protein
MLKQCYMPSINDERRVRIEPRSSATGGWAPADVAFSFREAAQNVPRNCWRAVERHFRDGHAEIWWAAELSLAG